MDARPTNDRTDASAAAPRFGIVGRILKAFNGGLFTRVAAVFGAAQRIVPPAP